MIIRKLILLASLSAFLLLGAGCQTQQAQERVPSLPLAVEELQTQTVPESKKQEKSEAATKSEPTQSSTALYRGSWFDIEYPKNFSARPTTPTNERNSVTHVLTDEAYFTSPDETVEFFVYSPLWSEDPETYLTIASMEEVISEKTEEVKENERPGKFGSKITYWVTVKAKDGSYYRSFISTKEQVGTGSDLHHVFGIKYKNNVSYEKYREAYVAFKKSLQQYAD
jgi:hypothetical protein